MSFGFYSVRQRSGVFYRGMCEIQHDKRHCHVNNVASARPVL